MKWLLTLTVSVMLLAGCATEEVDAPAFSEGQAKALVIESVNDKAILLEQLGSTPQIVDWGDRHLLACISASYSFTYEREFLKDSYQGDGVWMVWIDTKSNGASPLLNSVMEGWRPPDGDTLHYMDFRWLVYENTGTVLSEGKTFIYGDLESRHYC